MSTIMSRNPEKFEGYKMFRIKLDKVNDALLQIMYNDEELTLEKFFSSAYMKKNQNANVEYIYFHTKVDKADYVQKWNNEVDNQFNDPTILE